MPFAHHFKLSPIPSAFPASFLIQHLTFTSVFTIFLLEFPNYPSFLPFLKSILASLHPLAHPFSISCISSKFIISSLAFPDYTFFLAYSMSIWLLFSLSPISLVFHLSIRLFPILLALYSSPQGIFFAFTLFLVPFSNRTVFRPSF